MVTLIAEPLSTLAVKQKNVLYIEDNPANLKLVENLLARVPGVELMEAHSPVLGIDLALANRPDLILLDIKLPVMNGFEVLTCLREHQITQDIPVIAVTASAMQYDVEQYILAGFSDFIAKPFDVKEFYAKVDSFLNKKSR